MANSFLDYYRSQQAAAGVMDPRSDDQIMREDLVPFAEQNPSVLQQFPDFQQPFVAYREANAPPVGSEFTTGLKSGGEGMLADYAGMGALATGSDTLKQDAVSLSQAAAANQPTIRSLSDVDPGDSTLGRIFSKDAARYVLAKAGGALPAVGETVGLAAGGAALGSAIEPGAGTVAGATEGASEGLFGGGIIKSAIQSLIDSGAADDLVAKGVIQDATPEAISAAVDAGDQTVSNQVTAQAKAISAHRVGEAATLGNAYAMSAGGIYNETGDRNLALGLGAVGALAGAAPVVGLPARTIRSLFPELTGQAAQDAAEQLVGAKSSELMARLSRTGVNTAAGTAGMVGMEAANIVAKNLSQGKDALDLDDADWVRLREAAVGGAIASLPVSVVGSGAPLYTENVAQRPAVEPAVEPVPDAQPAAPGPAAASAAVFDAANQAPKSAADSAQAFGGPIEDAASLPATGEVAPTLGSLVGRRIRYAGQTGLLGQDGDGVFLLDTGKTPIEIEGAQKDGSSLTTDVGVEPIGASAVVSDGVVAIGNREFNLPDDPRDAINFNQHGNVTSVTLLDSETGAPRTIRDPDLAYQVADQLAQQHAAANPAVMQEIPDAQELAPASPDAAFIDRWTQGFNPYTVALSDTLDLHDSTMQDQQGGIVGDRPEFWQMLQGTDPRIDLVKQNLEQQIQRAEQADIQPATKKGLTDELYSLLDRVEQFEAQFHAGTPAAEVAPQPEGAAPQPADQGAAEPAAPAVPEPQPAAVPAPVGNPAGPVGTDVPEGAEPAAGGVPSSVGAPGAVPEAAGQPVSGASAEPAGGDVGAQPGVAAVGPGAESAPEPIGPENPPVAPAEQPVAPETQPKPPEDLRIPAIDRKLAQLDRQERRLGPYASKAREDLAEQRRSLMLERLQRQAEAGIPEARRALEEYQKQLDYHHSTGDADEVIRRYVFDHPLASPSAAEAQGMEMRGELQRLYENVSKGQQMRIFRNNGDVNINQYGQHLAEHLQAAGIHSGEFTEDGVLERISQAMQAPARTEPMPARVEGTPSITGPATGVAREVAPLRQGAVIEGAPTVDFRSDPAFADFSPEDWQTALNHSLQEGRGGSSGNRAETRIGVALQAPDGSVIFTGLVRPQTTLSETGVNAIKEPSLQRMGATIDGKRSIQDGGTGPALVSEVVKAGYQPVAVIHFDADPAKIFQRFSDVSEFDEAWRKSEKSTGRKILLPGQEGAVTTANRNQSELIQDIERLGNQIKTAKGDAYVAIRDQINQAYEELTRIVSQNQSQTGDLNVNDLPFRSVNPTDRDVLPVTADRTQQFADVVARLRNQGGKVDAMAKELFLQSSADKIQQQIDALTAQQKQATTDAMRAELTRGITQRQEALQNLKNAVGVTYTPWHIAVSMQDVQRANLGNLVSLLHEGAESLTMRLGPVMQGRVQEAVLSSLNELRAAARGAAEISGADVARETGAADLLAETMAQKLAAAGIPDHANLADSIVRWVKSLYYRVVMGAQAAFGRDPDPQVALDWFENQLRREVSGDYDYRIGRLLDRFLPEPLFEGVKRFQDPNGTPGGITDFFHPIRQRMDQPSFDTDSQGALDWNIQFRQTGDHPGEELDIPDPEARARIEGAALNQVQDWMAAIQKSVAPDMDPKDFWRAGWTRENPAKLLETLQQRQAGAQEAKIDGERMTKVMNDQASLEARRQIENIHAAAMKRHAELTEKIDSATSDVETKARQTTRLESDYANAALHNDELSASMKDLVKGYARDMNAGLEASENQGALMQAVRQAEGLLAQDPIPEEYQEVFRKIADGPVSVFSEIKAISQLDLPLADMTNREVMTAIHENSESDPALARLADNKPLAVALAVLARKNATQVDQIQYGWLRDTEQKAAITAELKAIRQAGVQQLKEILATHQEGKKSQSLRDRLAYEYAQARRSLQAQQERIETQTQQRDVVAKALPHLAETVEKAQQQGSTAPSEWYFRDGAEYQSMRQGEDGRWTAATKRLTILPDGSVQNGDMVRTDVNRNLQYLKDQQAKQGGKFYQSVERQTLELKGQDVQRGYTSGHVSMMGMFVKSVADKARTLGGNAGNRIARMVTGFDAIQQQEREGVSSHAARWSFAEHEAMKAAGIKDQRVFSRQIDNPVSYFLESNPGLDEAAALRRAVKMARARLTTPPAEDFDQKFAAYLRTTKAASENMVRIAEKNGSFVQDPLLKSGLRKAVAQGWLTRMRSMDGATVMTLIRDMQAAGWKIEMRSEPGEGGKMTRSYGKASTFADMSTDDLAVKNSDAVDKVLQSKFTPDIIQRWLLPFINKPGEEVMRNGDEPVPQAVLQNAWQESGGNVLKWIDAVGASLDLPEDDKTDPAAAWRKSALTQLDGLFGMEAKVASESSQVRDLFDPMGPKRHVIMDGRLNDMIPPEHLNYARFDMTGSRKLLGELAFNGAFGRNGERAVSALNEMANEAQADAQLHASLAGMPEGMQNAEAVARGKRSYQDLVDAGKRAKQIDGLRGDMSAMMGVNNPGSPFHEIKTGMEFLHFVAGQLVDAPKTALYHAASIFERNFAQHSFGPLAFRGSAVGAAYAAKTGLGSILESFGLHLFHTSEIEAELNQTMGGSRNLPYNVTLWGAIGDQTNPDSSLFSKYAVKMIRAARYLQHKGVGTAGENAEFPRFAPIPGLGVMNALSQYFAVGNAVAHTDQVQLLIKRGIAHFAANDADYQNPAFRFKASNLTSKMDTGVFDYFRNKLPEYGVGNLEDLVRGAMEPASKGERILTKDQVSRIALMASQTLDGAAGAGTTPAMLASNPILRIAMPLLRWPTWKMEQFSEGIGDKDGRVSFGTAQGLKSVMRGLGVLALVNLPVGMAFTFLMDDYDEKVLHKKSNLPDVDPVSGVPIIGPALALMTGDRTAFQNVTGWFARGAKAGNIGGLAADMMNQFIAPYDPNSGQRGFSMDQRILVMSQFLNFQQGMSNLVHTGNADWAGFWKPMFQSIGGNGAIQSLDIINNALGLDNQESRLVSRINASSYLRAAGQEAQVELRGSAGASTPTPVSTWTNHMLTAAMANDRMGFLDAYRNAQDAAKEMVGDDPNIPLAKRDSEARARVLQGWEGRSPLSVFRFKPTQAQLNQLLSLMDDQGKQDVADAVNRYTTFSRLIVPTAAQRTANQEVARLNSVPRSMAARSNVGLVAVP